MAWDASAQSNESSLFSRGSSWAGDDDNEGEDAEGEVGAFSSSSSSSSSFHNHNNRQMSPVATRQSRHFSFAEHASEDSGAEDDDDDRGGVESSGGSSGGSVPAEKERQLLLLMLLAQVCSLHDPTPKTFTVHVLELFERGILDRQSILFLFELGLVPSATSAKKKLLMPPSIETAESNEEYSMVNAQQKLRVHQRTAEASAIRMSLEQQERQQRYHKSPSEPFPHHHQHSQQPSPPSWAAKHHPLSLSRYQREFQQQRLLSSGAFGQVFQATNKMDGRDYAMKRIPFSATGYSRDSVQQVVREVHCLAICDHPNVVRYYTSWLEPSWMTGTGSGNTADHPNQHQKLLKDITHMVAGSHKNDHDNGSHDDPDSMEDATRRLQSYFGNNASSKRPRRRFSFGGASDNSWDMSAEARRKLATSVSKDDLFADDIFERSGKNDCHNPRRPPNAQPPPRKPKQNQDNYRYQICLFIQMQLCHPSTLADWIRERNNTSQQYASDTSLASRLGPVQEIFRQVCLGLHHVHERGIVHRDLKPANIFATVEGQLQFKIGDFGLSRLIRNVASPKHNTTTNRGPPLRLSSSEEFGGPCHENGEPQPRYPQATPDPMTAGVGTASYASPEQVSSKKYGKEADIYSLGLILLELICCFVTEHERYQTFHDCRHRRVVPKEVEEEFPRLAKTILACTEPKPLNRPSADQLALVDLASQQSCAVVVGNGDGAATKRVAVEEVPSMQKEDEEAGVGTSSELEELRRLLEEKDSLIRQLECELDAKDKRIAELQAKNERSRRGLHSQPSSGLHTYSAPQSSRELDQHEHSNTSSSEDEL